MAITRITDKMGASELFVGLGALALSFLLAIFIAVPAWAAPSDSSADVVNRLREIAGTDQQVTFAYGGTPDRPAYTWVFNGLDLPREQAANLKNLDLGIDVATEDTNGDGTEDALVLDFAHEGDLPIPAVVTVLVPSTFELTEAELALFLFDDTTGDFEQIQKGLTVTGGYVAFSLTHCSKWAVSFLDLTASAMPMPVLAPSLAAATPTLDAPAIQGIDLAFVTPWLVLAALFCACLIVTVMVKHSRRKAEAEIMERSWRSDMRVLRSIPSLDELMDEVEVVEPYE